RERPGGRVSRAAQGGVGRSVQRQRLGHRSRVLTDMTEFRQALDAYLAGQIDLAALKRVLSASLTKEPHLGAAAGAYIEALYRGNRIAGEAYLALVEATRAQVDAEKTRFRALGSASSPAAGASSAPRAPAATPAADGDKTVFR